MGDAESPDSTRTVVRHVGRRSGKSYETPVDAFDTDRGTLLVALPYGPDTDWSATSAWRAPSTSCAGVRR